MSRPHVAENGRWRQALAWTASLSVLLTAAMAWPVILAPHERIFGLEIVGRHHDPFTVMAQMAAAGPAWPFAQPATDWLGWLLARGLDPVVAYNLLVLSTFPLAAVAATALASYLGIPARGAVVAGLAYAFAPLHLAHAAYHPHVAQTHWLPLYLLALFAAVDRPTVVRLVWLVLACAGLALANFYAGLIGAVVTPIALPAYWWSRRRDGEAAGHLWRPAAVLGGLALMGGMAASAVLAGSTYAAPVADLAHYSARWWAYFVPPVGHPLLDGMAGAAFTRGGVDTGLVEQQVYVSVALLLLSGAALVGAVRGWPAGLAGRVVGTLAFVAAAAALVSVGPGAAGCQPGSWIPACRLHEWLPMFRAFARFAFVVHLVVSLLAGAGAAMLWRRSRRGAAVVAALLVIAAIEYAPLPARSRDVLPTSGHRWLAGQPQARRILECIDGRVRDANVGWLMRRDVRFLGGEIGDCAAPDLGARLAALGYTHLLIRHPRLRPPVIAPGTAGLEVVADRPDALVYAVTAGPPAVVTLGMVGFFDEETADDARWRWMGPRGQWRIRNTTGAPQKVHLEFWIESAAEARTVTMGLDGRPAGVVDAGLRLDRVTAGPWTLAPGDHTLTFTASGTPFVPAVTGASGDTRALTVAFHQTRWVVLPDE